VAEIPPVRCLLKDGTSVLVRASVEDDALGLLDCVRAYIDDGEGQVLLPSELTESEEQQRAWIHTLRRSDHDLVLVAEYEGQIIADLNFQAGKRARIAHWGDIGIGIRPGWRGKGLGSAMLGRLLWWAERAPRVEKISLLVVASNRRAIALYEKWGFRVEGRRARTVKYADGSYDDDLMMARFVEAHR
jgi:RimJ/RimL family protein N-acetyltransferase